MACATRPGQRPLARSPGRERAPCTPAHPHRDVLGSAARRKLASRSIAGRATNVLDGPLHALRHLGAAPYAFTTVDQLLADFFAEVRRVCAERNITDTVVRVSEKDEML